MGAAAYRRGSKVISHGVSADLAARGYSVTSPKITGAEPLTWSDERARLQADLMDAQAEIVALKARVDAAERMARAADGQAERSHRLASQHFRLHMAAAARLAWAWKVIRAYVSPRLVQEFRDEEPEPTEDDS